MSLKGAHITVQEIIGLRLVFYGNAPKTAGASCTSKTQSYRILSMWTKLCAQNYPCASFYSYLKDFILLSMIYRQICRKYSGIRHSLCAREEPLMSIENKNEIHVYKCTRTISLTPIIASNGGTTHGGVQPGTINWGF